MAETEKERTLLDNIRLFESLIPFVALFDEDDDQPAPTPRRRRPAAKYDYDYRVVVARAKGD